MAFVVSEGMMRGLERLQAPAPYQLQLTDGFSQAYAEIWRRQQAVRTVVSFLGRNIASIGLHAYERVSNTDRRRVLDHPLTQLLSQPNGQTTRYRMIDALVQDIAIFDAAYLLKMKTADGRMALLRLPPDSVEPIGSSGLVLEGFRFRGSNGSRDFSAAQVIYFHGYNPVSSAIGSSPIESLRRVLAEEYEAGRMREQILRNGARINGYIQRPKEAPPWSDPAKKKFARSWKAQYTGGGPETGGTPVLEDGMSFVSAGQTAQQLQYIESRKLTREEVAAAYFIPPPMVGIMDGATFSNITEQHKMLYQDTLGPWLEMIQQELNAQLVPDLADDGIYVEFNIQGKLQGSFEEQAQSMSMAAGAPWMTRNEIRAMNNLPAVDDGDALVIPLNVLTGGQASPRDSGSQNRRSGQALVKEISRDADSGIIKIKSAMREEDSDLVADVLQRFFDRQGKSVLTRLGAKDPGWWDQERWDRELSADLYALSVSISSDIGGLLAAELGVPDGYDVDRTYAFLRAFAGKRASMINAATRDQIQAALDDELSDDAERSTPRGVFEQAKDVRAREGGITLATTLATFATVEAGRHLNRPRTTKTWVVTSRNPRPSHVRMHGETVGLEENFSNGMAWPGDYVGGPDEVASCRCDIELTIP